MTDILSGLTTEADIQTETDSVGTSFAPLESALYALKIILAYITVSAGEAMCLNVLFETPDKNQLRQQFWMTSGKKKGKRNFYEKKNPTTGAMEKHYLPGFNQANGLALLTCNKGINTLKTEVKTIKLYDYITKSEQPQDVDMVMELIGKETSAGVIKQIVDKNVENAAYDAKKPIGPDNMEYIPSGITRIENEVDKLFHTDGRTITEIKADVAEPTFRDTWLERWEGKLKDKSAAKKGHVTAVPTAGSAAGPVSGAPTPPQSLFK
jgi:hypothetical protein